MELLLGWQRILCRGTPRGLPLCCLIVCTGGAERSAAPHLRRPTPTCVSAEHVPTRKSTAATRTSSTLSRLLNSDVRPPARLRVSVVCLVHRQQDLRRAWTQPAAQQFHSIACAPGVTHRLRMRERCRASVLSRHRLAPRSRRGFESSASASTIGGSTSGCRCPVRALSISTT